MVVSYEVLKRQDAVTSAAIIEHYASGGDGDDKFVRLSKYEGDLTVTRDKEDDDKLQVGIDYAKDKGVIDRDYVPEPYVEIDVLGKSPNDVAEVILGHLKGDDESAAATNVIVLVGLSGTGKGTTVSRLRQRLEDDEKKKVVTWSNGNIFRSVTLLAASWCEQQEDIPKGTFDADKALTKENIASFMSMLSFGKYRDDGSYDTKIDGLGHDGVLVSDVQNTLLKSPSVSKNIPTVAQYTQGEVIMFAANAIDVMSKDGVFVLLEGREQTVNYVRTPHRFTLTLSDDTLIGKRRAAQRLMGSSIKSLANATSATDDDVTKALDEALDHMVNEIH